MDTEVIIVGAGPVGLMLAGELRLAGVDVIVLEQRLTRSGESRGVGFTARATELFRQRGLLGRLGDVDISRQGHFGGIPLDFGVLEGSHFGVRGVPQHRIEQMLEEWVTELGATVLRGQRLVGLDESGDTVTALVEGPDGRAERGAAHLVGCDGGRSTVRQLGGFDFPGSDATREMYLADVLGGTIRPRPIGERVPGGMVMSGPLGDGVDRIIVCPTGAPPDAFHQRTFAEVAEVWEQLTGESLRGARASWVSTFTDATRQVTQYRRGRVLLAGDAAHIHLPAGGQGLSLGVQDAANLGWKLAATINGWAPEGLLDTYHGERHPVGERVLRNTLAQGTLYLSGAEIEPLRSVMTELMAIPDVGRHLSGMVSGLDIRYAGGIPGHPLIGMRMPDAGIELVDGRRVVVSDLLRRSRGVLIDHSPRAASVRLADAWNDRVDLVAARRITEPADVESVLIRPDGYVAWAGPGGGDLREALERWFGSARDGVRLPAGSEAYAL
jgi:bifunctional hydroxylase/dehydrase